MENINFVVFGALKTFPGPALFGTKGTVGGGGIPNSDNPH